MQVWSTPAEIGVAAHAVSRRGVVIASHGTTRESISILADDTYGGGAVLCPRLRGQGSGVVASYAKLPIAAAVAANTAAAAAAAADAPTPPRDRERVLWCGEERVHAGECELAPYRDRKERRPDLA